MEPIPSPDGRWMVGMLCRCGHAQEKHGHRLAELPEIMVGVLGAHVGSAAYPSAVSIVVERPEDREAFEAALRRHGTAES